MRIGMRVRVTSVADNVLPEVKLYVGKVGKIAGYGDSLNGVRGYYVQFDDGSHTKKLYENELERVKP